MFSFRRKPVPIRRPWFGPLALAQPELLKRLELIPSYLALCRRGLSPECTLLFVPEQKESFEAEIFVIGQMFSWDDQSPVLWLFSTVGLCTIEQPTRGNRPAFRRFELVLGTWPNQTPDPDPFPGQRLGVVLSMEGQLPGWDWDQVVHPPLIRWLAYIGQEFASWMKCGSHFALFDTLTYGLGRPAWTRSILEHSVLLPASVHMQLSGLAPFNRPTDPKDVIAPKDWFESPGTDQFEYGYYWLLPVSKTEHERAQATGTQNVFADLADRAPEEANDCCYVAFDLLRRDVENAVAQDSL